MFPPSRGVSHLKRPREDVHVDGERHSGKHTPMTTAVTPLANDTGNTSGASDGGAPHTRPVTPPASSIAAVRQAACFAPIRSAGKLPAPELKRVKPALPPEVMDARRFRCPRMYDERANGIVVVMPMDVTPSCCNKVPRRVMMAAGRSVGRSRPRARPRT